MLTLVIDIPTVKTITLGEFINEEMRKRDVSAREFADEVGVSSTLINKFLLHGIADSYSGRPIGEPSIDFLKKLARATHTDICVLVAMVAPDEATGTKDTLPALLLDRIRNLTPDQREIVSNFLLSLSLKKRDK